MNIDISPDRHELGRRACARVVEIIREAINERGEANIVVATGASQFGVLSQLTTADLPWNDISGFHLDEYIGIPLTHPASFRLYLWQRFVSKLPVPLKAFYYLNVEGDPAAEARRLGSLLAGRVIDLAMVGIGENGHMAFNDPPADFETEEPYIVVQLDDACRRQQLGEGWFRTLTDVPTSAVSMSIRQILKSRAIVACVPDARKARAVRESVFNPVSPQYPSTCLQQHKRVWLFVDEASAAELRGAAPIT